MCRLCGSVAPNGSTAACQRCERTKACDCSARMLSFMRRPRRLTCSVGGRSTEVIILRGSWMGRCGGRVFGVGVYNLRMAKRSKALSEAVSPRWYRGTDIPLCVIRRFARAVAERFHPDRIILFGSYAYGTPHADSDVDILVIMPARNQLDQAVKIHLALLPPFPLDLIVRTPRTMKWRLEE